MNNLTLCVGADVHLDDILLRAVDKLSGHEVIEPFHVTHNLPGAQSAATTIAEVATRWGYTRIEIGCEATGMLWIPFHRFLSTSPLLRPFEVEVICFNPKLIAHFKDGLVPWPGQAARAQACPQCLDRLARERRSGCLRCRRPPALRRMA